MPLKNSQYDALMREYNRRQAEDYRRQAACIEEIHARIPAVAECERQIRALSLEQFASRVQGDDSGRALYRAKLDDLIHEKEKLLTDAGYPADYMQMHYTCPDCKDTGYIGQKRCHCFIRAAAALRYDQSGLQQVLEKENFSTFTDQYYDDKVMVPELGMTVRQHMRHIVSQCLAYINQFGEKHDSLLFTGNTGVGKTFLTHCIAKALLDQGYSVVSFTASQLFSLFSSQISHREDDDLAELDSDILDCDLLIIDDLGTELGNTFDNAKLFHCINQRLLLQKSTIISTNLSLEAVTDRYSVRVTSRLFSEYQVLPLFGSDIRKEKARTRDLHRSS